MWALLRSPLPSPHPNASLSDSQRRIKSHSQPVFPAQNGPGGVAKSPNTGAPHAEKVLAKNMIGKGTKKPSKSAQRCTNAGSATNRTFWTRTLSTTTKRAIDVKPVRKTSTSRMHAEDVCLGLVGVVASAFDSTLTGPSGANTLPGISKRGTQWRIGSMQN